MQTHLLRTRSRLPALKPLADFDSVPQRECIRQYMETAIAQFPECPTCRTPITIDLGQDALEQDTSGRQGILARIDPSKMQTSTKIEAL